MKLLKKFKRYSVIHQKKIYITIFFIIVILTFWTGWVISLIAQTRSQRDNPSLVQSKAKEEIAPLNIEFSKDNRYFPVVHYQLSSPVFIWENFKIYNKSLWGDNQNGNISVDKRSGLILKTKQMIWLLWRLHYGILEFRWLDLGNSINDTEGDKYFGFGDPGEGLAAGFRIYNTSSTKNELYAITIKLGQLYQTLIPWENDFTRARWFIEWKDESIKYSIATEKAYKVVAEHKSTDIPNIGLPDGRMEVSIQNSNGKSPITVSLVKYDAY